MIEVKQSGERDRLPWLEPYREAKAPPPPRPRAATPVAASARRSYVRVPMWLFIFLGAGVLGIGGYFIGRQTVANRAGPSVTAELPQATLPYHSLDELANEVEPPPPPPLSEVEKTAEAAPTVAPAPKSVSSPKVRKAAAKKRTTAGRPARRVARRAATRPTPPHRPRFVVRRSPPPVAGRAGQVIELGRFTSPRTADAVWRRAVWRYPYLGRLSKVVAPTRTSRPQPVFALRLGTGSRSHAQTLCRNLHSIGYPCAIV